MLFLACTSPISNGCYTSIISFGDSLADTGNAKVLAQYDKVDPPHFLFPPYGETYFHNPTGRCSNGRLIIDFLAESLGFPLISPYFQHDQDVANSRLGLNYAVASATALNSSFHEAKGYNVPTNASLGVQLGWFKQSLSSLCDSISDCRKLLQSSLILMGEIGGNDYNHAVVAGKSIHEIKPYVPLVVKTITSTINDLIDLGAQTLIVPGNLPIGCSPVYLTIYDGIDSEEYDTAGCLIRFNKFAEYHNELLKGELNQIRELYPSVDIIYGDYYNAALQFYRSPNDFGFSEGALKACCGGGGPFNYNQSAECASSSSITCAEPSTYVNWDGLHLTESAYRLIFESLFKGSYTTPPFNSLCSTALDKRDEFPLFA